MTKTKITSVVLTGAALVLAGCGSASSGPGVAHLGADASSGSKPAGGGGSPAEVGAVNQQKMVAYAQCMRSHGVPEFPEPTEGRLVVHSSDRNGKATGVDPGSPAFAAAQKACGKLAPAGLGHSVSPQQQKQMQEGALKMSACMRSHGVPNFPDPKFSGNSVQIKISPASGVDPSSPVFQAAQKACQSKTPGLPAEKGGPTEGGFGTSGGPKGE